MNMLNMFSILKKTAAGTPVDIPFPGFPGG
jgi:hypothetical protein